MKYKLKGHKVIDAEKLNNFLKTIIPEHKFDRNFIAYKIAQHEDEVLKSDYHTALLNEIEEGLPKEELEDMDCPFCTHKCNARKVERNLCRTQVKALLDKLRKRA